MKITAVAWVLKRFRLLIIVMTIIAFLVGAYYSMYVVKPVFGAKTVIMITTTDENNVQKFDYVTILANRQLVKVYSEIIQSNEVLDRLALLLGESVTAEQLKKAITVRQVGGTELIEIDALSGDPQSAASIANETAIVFIRHISEIFRVNNVKVLEAAVENVKPLKPNLWLNIITVTLLGFCITVALCLTFAYVRQPSGMPGVLDASLFLAQIPRLMWKKKNWDKLFKNNIIKNSFLYLQTLLIKKAGNSKTILLTSTSDGEGKSTISEGLALTLCQAGHKVTVINADFNRTDKKTRPLSLKGDPVGENITETGGCLDFLQLNDCTEPRIVESTNSDINIYRILSSPIFESFLQNKAAQTDYILIDGPALSGHAEAILLATKVDGVLLVTRAGTAVERLNKVLHSLELAKAAVLGVVLNNL